MSEPNPRQGIRKNSSSPGSIINNQHHDPSGSQKSANGVPATIKAVVAASNVATPLEDYAMVWAVNRDTSVHYVMTGDFAVVNAATVSATNGMAIPPGAGVLLECGASPDSMKGLGIKTDSTTVHLTVLEV